MSVSWGKRSRSDVRNFTRGGKKLRLLDPMLIALHKNFEEMRIVLNDLSIQVVYLSDA